MSNKGLFVMLMFSVSLLLGVCTGMSLASRERADMLSVQATQIPSETPASTFIQTQQPKIEVSVPEKYMVTLTDTHIMIYKINTDGSMQLIEEKQIDSEGLRREDYEMLFKGVTLDTLSEAREMLEDYIN